MELLEGKTLADLINEGPVSSARALDIVCQTLRGLAFAHRQGIAHRDLKPANIFLQALPDHADHVRLLDFGTAKFLEGASSTSLAENLSRVGAVFGTPAYMAPSRPGRNAWTRGRTSTRPVRSCFSCWRDGCRTWPRRPRASWRRTSPRRVPSLAELRPDLSIARLVQPVIERAMAKKPADRYRRRCGCCRRWKASKAAGRAWRPRAHRSRRHRR
jgi:serine/threonine-protein kinase